MKRLRERGGRFYLLSLLLAGPPVWIMSVAALVSIIKGQSVDYQSLGFGISAVIGAVGLGAGASKFGSAQQDRARRSGRELDSDMFEDGEE